MIGTDYNPDGIRGIGPKKGSKLLRERSVEEAFDSFEADFDWERIVRTIREMPVASDYKLEWRAYDAEAILNHLIGDHVFSENRVESARAELDSIAA